MIQKMLSVIKNIKLVDKFLIIIMILLFTQSAYSLFTLEKSNSYTDSIDIVVRTTIAAIFGYFISVNFVKTHIEICPCTIADTKDCLCQNDDPSAEQLPMEQTLRPNENTTYSINNLQIFIVGTMCLAAIIILLVARNFFNLNVSTTPTITQLRDIVCGCVGFLLGIPTVND